MLNRCLKHGKSRKTVFYSNKQLKWEKNGKIAATPPGPPLREKNHCRTSFLRQGHKHLGCIFKAIYPEIYPVTLKASTG